MGAICNRRVFFSAKGKLNPIAGRPTIMYGLVILPLTKRHEAKQEVTESKMLHFSMGVTKMDKK